MEKVIENKILKFNFMFFVTPTHFSFFFFKFSILQNGIFDFKGLEKLLLGAEY
jgi:hypothetical protein